VGRIWRADAVNARKPCYLCFYLHHYKTHCLLFLHAQNDQVYCIQINSCKMWYLFKPKVTSSLTYYLQTSEKVRVALQSNTYRNFFQVKLITSHVLSNVLSIQGSSRTVYYLDNYTVFWLLKSRRFRICWETTNGRIYGPINSCKFEKSQCVYYHHICRPSFCGYYLLVLNSSNIIEIKAMLKLLMLVVKSVTFKYRLQTKFF